MKSRFPSLQTVVRALASGDSGRILPGARDPSLFERHAAALDAAEARARAALDEPVPAIPWSKFRLFVETGDRAEAEKPYFQRRALLSDLRLVLFAGRDRDGACLAKLEDVLWEICNEYTWALPAHLPSAGAAGCGVRPDRRTLDLFASETGFYVAETLHFFADRLSPRIVARCRAELRERIFDSYLDPAYDICWWEHGRNNWSAVCGGSIGAAFLYAGEDPGRIERAIVRVLGTLELFVNYFPDDGACEEGPSYWEYGFGFFAVFAELLHEYTGGGIDLFDNPDVRAIASFPERICLSGTRAASFADCPRFFSPQRMLTALFRRHYPDMAPCDGAIPPSAGGSPRPAFALRDFLWSDPETRGVPTPDAVSYFPDSQWLVVRRAPFAFAAAFGNNGVSHNHNDVGSFLLLDGDLEGPMDLGSGRYTRQYFGPERYGDAILCCGSQGHSLPIVGGALQKTGGEYAARDVRMETMPDGSLAFSGDIAGAYGLASLRSLRRAFAVRPDAGSVAVADDFVFDGEAPAIVERFIGYETPVVEAPGSVRFGAFRARFDPSLAARVRDFPFPSRSSPDPVAVHALDICLPAGTTSFRVEFTRLAPGETA